MFGWHLFRPGTFRWHLSGTCPAVRKTLWLHADEAEALREKAYQERRAESVIVREALRGFLGIED
jgi:hypothetical protein